jgi:hypothetical protein
MIMLYIYVVVYIYINIILLYVSGGRPCSTPDSDSLGALSTAVTPASTPPRRKGGISIPHPYLREWADYLLDLIRESVNLPRDGKDCYKSIHDEIFGRHRKRLEELFKTCWEKLKSVEAIYETTSTEVLTEIGENKLRLYIQEILTSKVLHSRFNVYMTLFSKTLNTSRVANRKDKGMSSMTHRDGVSHNFNAKKEHSSSTSSMISSKKKQKNK